MASQDQRRKSFPQLPELMDLVDRTVQELGTIRPPYPDGSEAPSILCSRYVDGPITNEMLYKNIDIVIQMFQDLKHRVAAHHNELNEARPELPEDCESPQLRGTAGRRRKPSQETTPKAVTSDYASATSADIDGRRRQPSEETSPKVVDSDYASATSAELHCPSCGAISRIIEPTTETEGPSSTVAVEGEYHNIISYNSSSSSSSDGSDDHVDRICEACLRTRSQCLCPIMVDLHASRQTRPADSLLLGEESCDRPEEEEKENDEEQEEEQEC